MTTLLSALVAILVSLESVFHLREQWKNYRSTEQFLEREKFLFLTREGPHRKLHAGEAFLRLVERIENAVASENAATLSTLTMAPGERNAPSERS